jgi:hypothetical protein
MKKDTYYFSHDFNANSDEKLLYLRSKFGMEGYGLYWYFIEKMHEANDSKLTCCLLDGIAFNLCYDPVKLKEFYNECIDLELFMTDGLKYWSDRVIRNKEQFDEKKKSKSIAGKRGMESRWNNTVITNDNTVITKHNKGKERKGKESKVNRDISNEEIVVNEKISNAPLLDQVKMSFVQNGGNQEMAEIFFNKHSATGWNINGNPIINFVSLIPNFILNYNKFNQSKPNQNGKSTSDEKFDFYKQYSDKFD